MQSFYNTLKSHCAPFVCLLLSAFPAAANDGAAGLDGGDLVFKNLKGVEMRSETLTINPEKVSVEYEFYNKTAKDIETIVSFPIEILLETDTTFDTEARNPNEFTVIVNGKKQTFETKSKKAEGVLTVQHFWTQKFPPNTSTNIRHSYRPIYGSDMVQMIVASKGGEKDIENMRSAYYADFGKQFCMTKNQRKQMQNNRYIFDVLRYVLVTANTWDGPIKNFKLRLEKGKRDFVFLCTDLDLKKVGPGVFEATKTNFKPAKDLHIAYARRADKI